MISTLQNPLQQPTDPAVEAELDRLPTTPIVQLRARYGVLFRTDPPKAFGPDLLRRSIAQRIQENAYGGLPRSTQRLLEQLVKAAIAKPNGRLELPRRIKPGSELVRIWKGRRYRVTVMAGEFAYDGKTYSNLSEIAVLITGTQWNGPRFFGLRSKTPESEQRVAPDQAAGVSVEAGPVRPPRLAGGSDYRKWNAAAAEEAAVRRVRRGR